MDASSRGSDSHDKDDARRRRLLRDTKMVTPQELDHFHSSLPLVVALVVFILTVINLNASIVILYRLKR